MLQTSVQFLKEGQSLARKKFWCALFGAGFGLSGYAWYRYNEQYLQAKRHYDQVFNDISKFEPYELRGEEAVYFPWYTTQSLKDWEYKIVKLTGYFKEERFFVSRQKDGKKGYLVFAPFITAHKKISIKTADNSPPILFGVVVNLGWVPLENLDEIEMTNEPVKLLEFDEDQILPKFPERFTGFIYDKDYQEKDVELPLTQITGIVKRGESANILRGRRNWSREGVYNFIDLHLLSRFFKFINYDQAQEAYIERINPEFSEDEQNVFPVPSTKDDFFYETDPKVYLKSSSIFGTFSLLNAAGILVTLLRR